MEEQPLGRRLAAELFGTFWLTFGGCGSAVLAAYFIGGKPGAKVQLGIGFVGVSLAFGLTVLTMAYAIGHISGCHLNPAVSLGLWAAKRFKASDLLPYIAVQVAGAILAAGLLYVVANGVPGGIGPLTGPGAFATNGFGKAGSPGGFDLISCLVIEVVLTFVFLMIICGATDRRAPAGFAPIAIGLGLTLIHLISIPVTNTSVNPARSTGPALIVGGVALTQLWLFWLAPIVGGLIGGGLYRFLSGESIEEAETEPASLDGE